MQDQTREIVLDTETTGISPAEGHRLVEIGAIELINHMPTGQTFHVYLNPERDMPKEAEAVHGLSATFLADKPVFSTVAASFLEFIQGGTLVIHNASFDVGFLNAELARANLTQINLGHVIDTLHVARRKHPMASNSLDALCRRYGVDNSKRTKHGALLDAELLAEVYLELLGGRQTAMNLAASPAQAQSKSTSLQRPMPLAKSRQAPLPNRLTEEELNRHAEFVSKLSKEPLWFKKNQ